MPQEDHLGAQAGPGAVPGAASRPDSAPPSRRAVLRGAASAGAAGMAATALTGLGGSALAAQGAGARDEAAGAGGAAGAESSEQFVVHVRDARTGHIDVFRGAGLIRLHDPELAAHLVRAIRR